MAKSMIGTKKHFRKAGHEAGLLQWVEMEMWKWMGSTRTMDVAQKIIAKVRKETLKEVSDKNSKFMEPCEPDCDACVNCFPNCCKPDLAIYKQQLMKKIRKVMDKWDCDLSTYSKLKRMIIDMIKEESGL